MVMHLGAHRCRSSLAAAAAAAAAVAVAVALALAAALHAAAACCAVHYSVLYKLQLCEQTCCKPELHRTIVVLVYTILKHEQTSQSGQSAATSV
eukprot:12635-Heterococcus_DN1.PRE.3